MFCPASLIRTFPQGFGEKPRAANLIKTTAGGVGVFTAFGGYLDTMVAFFLIPFISHPYLPLKCMKILNHEAP